MKHRKFFTLLELLSVIGIIAIVAGIILGGMSYAGRRADQAKTLSIIEGFTMALEAFKEDRGFYPIVSTAAQVKFEAGAGNAWDKFLSGHSSNNRPYMEGIQDGTELKDAYGNMLWYQCPGTNNPQKFDLWSTGADGEQGDKNGVDFTKAGNGDDICNWKRN